MDGQIDVIKAELIRNALLSAAGEMHDTLVRSAYNPLIFDVKDFGVTVLSADGSLWAEAPGLPVFLGALPETVRSGLATWGADGFTDGDVLIANCPYLTGTHISDTAVYMPVFHQGSLVAFTATMAHWADIGGMSPGGWTFDSSSIYQEGLRFTHQRLQVGGSPNVDLLDFIKSNVRVPDTVMGDLDAQIATCRTGADRVRALCDQYGAGEVDTVMAHVLTKTESALRQEIAALPDGSYSAGLDFDFDGVDRDNEPHLQVAIEIAGDRLSVDFTGTSKAAAGPINIGRPATLSSVASAVKGILDPLGVTNQAHLNIADILWPEGNTLVTPCEPAPCDSYGYVGTGITESVGYALAEIAPDRGRAGSYQMWAEYVMCVKSSDHPRYVLQEPVQGGHGAFPGADGATLVFTGDGDTYNTPVEVMETRYPVRCEQFALNPESAGPGEFRGGLGVRRDIRVLQPDSEIKTALENTKDPLSKGVAGGLPGLASRTELTLPSGEVVVQHERIGDTAVDVGTVVGVRTGGGGGYGPPLQRDPQRVADDLRDEIVTLAVARDTYGVVARPGDSPGSWVVDAQATATLRSTLSSTTPENH